jgi:hypothetical protein
MAFVTPTDVTVGSVLTASKYNADVVANMKAMGLVHITSANISGTTVTLDNIFTTTYRAYRIHLYVVRALSWASAVLRTSAPANLGGSLYDQTVIQTTTNVDKTRVTANAQTSWANLFLTGDRGTFATIDIINPAQTAYTHAVVNAFSSENADASSKAASVVGGFGYRDTTAAAGISFTVGTGATGIARVYAYGEG